MSNIFYIELKFKDDWKNIYKFTSNWEQRYQNIMQKAGWESCKWIVEDIKAKSRDVKTGKKYKVKKNAKTYYHTASSSNGHETSARLTGTKNKSTKFDIDIKQWTIGVLKSVKYGRAIEEGYTRGNRKLTARHDLKRGVERNMKRTIACVFNWMERDLKGYEVFYHD